MNSIMDYRTYLKNELERRCRQNQSYSLRSYARDLGLSAGRLSDVLKEKSGLSAMKAKSIAKTLSMNQRESEWFITLVESTDARSRKERTDAQRKIRGLKTESAEYHQVSLDQFKVISDWQHLAIIDLIQTRGFRNDSNWMAKRLGISKIEIEQSVDRLERLGLIKKELNTLKAIALAVSTPTDIPSDAIKNFHRQILKKALSAVDMHKVENRDFSCITFPVSKSLLPEAKLRIKKFRREFNRWVQNSKLHKEEVYSLGLYLFSLTEETK